MNSTSPPLITSARWGTRTKRIVAIALLIGSAISLFYLSGMIPMLVISALLSYLLWPLVNIIDRRITRLFGFQVRSLSVALTFVILIAVFTVSFIVVIPVIVGQIEQLGDRIPVLAADLESGLRRTLSHPLSIGGTPILLEGEPIIPIERFDAITEGDPLGVLIGNGEFDIFAVIGGFLMSVGAPAFSVLGGAFVAVINLAFIIVIMFYLMRDGEAFVAHFVNITPKPYQGDMRRLFYELGRVWNAYLRGQLILCVAVGTAVYVAALFLGLPGAPMLGLIAALLEFIPNVGPIVATIPAVLVALLSESSTIPFLSGLPFALTVAVVWTIIQQIESVYLTPRVMGGELHLHPVVVVIALLAGASVGGAVGVILAAPFTATGRVFGQYFYGKLFDVEPFSKPKPYEIVTHRTRLLRLWDHVRRRLKDRRAHQPQGADSAPVIE